jgi:hypothetical protein
MSDETTSAEDTDDLAGGAKLSRAFDRFEGPHTIGSSTRFWTGFWILTALAFAYPFTTNEFAILTTTVLFVWVFLSLSLSVIWGYTGIFSFGQTAFFGIGGYTFGVIGINLIPITGGTNLRLYWLRSSDISFFTAVSVVSTSQSSRWQRRSSSNCCSHGRPASSTPSARPSSVATTG